MRCLPDNIRDPFGRPLLFLKVVAFDDESSESCRSIIIANIERLRAYLQTLNARQDNHVRSPILQYIVLLDLADLSIQSIVSQYILSLKVYG